MLKEILKDKNFRIPLLNGFLTLVGLFFKFDYIFLIPLFWGIYKFFEESYEKIKEGKYSLDYLAFLSLFFSFIFKKYLVGAIIGVMYLTSTFLEEFGVRKAEKSLKDLIENFPKECVLKNGEIKKIQDVKIGEIILVRSNEIIPLDGYLLNDVAILNEANLTGEYLPREFKKGDFVKSGIINVGQTIELEVANDFSSSNYQKILNLIKEAKNKSPDFVRLTEKLNLPFTILTLILTFLAWFLFKDQNRVLAILAIATPCPLLIASPISFIGGINKGVKKNIIFKKPYLMEIFNKIKVIFFDKTGTLTLGNVFIKEFLIFKKDKDEKEILKIVGSLEMHSIHPIAKSIVNFVKQKVDEFYHVSEFKEIIGEGIYGKINNNLYEIKKSKEKVDGIGIDVFENGEILARFILDDILKDGAINVLKEFSKNYVLAIVTGDREENVKRFFKDILNDLSIEIFSDCTPERKFELVNEFRKKYGYIAVVGDGVNDAPALALADIGIVFSGTENSAALDAADIVILSHDINNVFAAFEISKNSYKIAKQSVILGIGLSILGMIFAFLGFIKPELAAFIQEAIDFFVIFNALRATF